MDKNEILITKVSKIKENGSAISKSVNEDLEKARKLLEPTLKKIQNIDEKELNTIKSMSSPPEETLKVIQALMCILDAGGMDSCRFIKSDVLFGHDWK
jgi:hypothetical protein